MHHTHNQHLPIIGEPFPELQAAATSGIIRLPKDMKGHWFLLFTHPSDFTPVCTSEFIAFQKRINDFEDMDCKLVGFSLDQVPSHIKWMEWMQEKIGVGIEFPIIAGTESLAQTLGILHPVKRNATIRATFIVDPKGILRISLFYPPEVGRSMDELVRVVKALQTADEQGDTPADWPNNGIIGDDVFVSLPKTFEESRHSCADKGPDWCFRHKSYEKRVR